MPYLERLNPETACPESGAHHPHVLICGAEDDECEDQWYLPYYAPYNVLRCCVCGQDWPCPRKRMNVLARKLGV
jgi:hypothetical protein